MADSMHDYKMRFAALLQRVAKDQRLQAAPLVAKQVVGKETAQMYPVFVIQISEEWPFDPEVMVEMDRLELIPKPKEVVLNDLYSIVANKYAENREKIQAIHEYGVLMGWTTSKPKEGTATNELLSHLQALHNAVTNPVDT
jgi:hypothetical protein